MNIFIEPWIKQTDWLQVSARSGLPSNCLWRRSGDLCCSWCGWCVSTLSVYSLQPVLRWRVLPKTHLTLAGGRIMTAEWREMQLNCWCWVAVSSDLSSVINNVKCACRSLASSHANIQNSLIILYFFLPFSLSLSLSVCWWSPGGRRRPRVAPSGADGTGLQGLGPEQHHLVQLWNPARVQCKKCEKVCACVESDIDRVYKQKIFRFFALIAEKRIFLWSCSAWLTMKMNNSVLQTQHPSFIPSTGRLKSSLLTIYVQNPVHNDQKSPEMLAGKHSELIVNRREASCRNLR